MIFVWVCLALFTVRVVYCLGWARGENAANRRWVKGWNDHMRSEHRRPANPADTESLW